jgi:RNA polymerase sigma-70 factor (ECF subfamily)
MDETEIRKLLDAGEHREAFERIVDAFQEKAFHLALSLTRNHATARDLAQDSLLRVWKALPSYNGTASLSTWIYTITRNCCLTELARARRRQTFSLDEPDSALNAETLAAPDLPEATSGLDVEAMLSRLPERTQRVVRLFYLEQKSYEETAALLGVPLGTLKTLLFRARKELARMAAESPSQLAAHLQAQEYR